MARIIPEIQLESRLQQIVLSSAVSCLGSLLIGVLIWREEVFVRSHYAFQFITVGILGSVFFNFLRFTNSRDAGASLLVLCVLQFLITGSSGILSIARDIAYVLAAGAAMYLFFTSYFVKGRGKGVHAPLLVAALLGACNLIASMVLVLIGGHSIPEAIPAITLTVVLGILIGLGIGTGIFISAKLISSRKEQ